MTVKQLGGIIYKDRHHLLKQVHDTLHAYMYYKIRPPSILRSHYKFVIMYITQGVFTENMVVDILLYSGRFL